MKTPVARGRGVLPVHAGPEQGGLSRGGRPPGHPLGGRFSGSPSPSMRLWSGHTETEILSTTSLMVGGEAARGTPWSGLAGCRVCGWGLHIVVIEGSGGSTTCHYPASGGPGRSVSVRPGAVGCPLLLRSTRFAGNSGPRSRRNMRRFAADRACGLDHANAHKHMHMHPTVGRMLIDEGRRYGLPAIRIPAEPPDVVGEASIGARAMFHGNTRAPVAGTPGPGCGQTTRCSDWRGAGI